MKKVLSTLLLLCFVIGMIPMMTQAKVITVVEQDFDSVSTVKELSLGSSIEKKCWIASDKSGADKADQMDRVAGGHGSLEKEGDNQYLRVSDRLGNFMGHTIPLASAAMVEKAGVGKYALQFDIKMIRTDKIWSCVLDGEANKSYPNVGRTYFFPVDYSDDAGDIRVSIGGVTLKGTAPGDVVVTNQVVNTVPTDGQWHTFYGEFDLASASALTVNIWGGYYGQNTSDYAIDNIKILRLDAPDTMEDLDADAGKTNVSEEGYKLNGLVVNLDDSCFTYGQKGYTSSIGRDEVVAHVKQYVGSHVTDLILTLNTQFMSMRPSEVWDDQIDEYKKTGDAQAQVWAHYDEIGIDPWAVWVECLWDYGINPWMGFRMNDVHGHDSDGILTGDFFWENLDKYARVRHRDHSTYRGDRAFDYTFEEVREKWLAYIEETVMTYDLYGIEMDWMRDPVFTTYGNELAAMDILTDHVREIRKIVDKAEEKWGHKIQISVRCPRDIQTCYESGFDIMTWCEEGLLDMISPSAYYTTDTEIPVMVWDNILKPYDVVLAPNVTQGEFYIQERNRTGSDFTYYTHVGGLQNNLETILGTAASYYSQGADKLYVFNVGVGADTIYESEKVDSDKIYPINNDAVRWRMLTYAGSEEKVLENTRRYTLTYQDFAGIYGTSDAQLPKKFERINNHRYLQFITGEINDTDKVTLTLAVEEGALPSQKAMEIYVNNVKADYIGTGTDDFGYIAAVSKTAKIYNFEVDASVINGAAAVEISTNDNNRPFTVIFAELKVEPQK